MNTYTKMVGLSVLVLSAATLQAHTFTIKNLTQASHSVAIHLKADQKPSEAQTVEAYGAKPGLLSRIQGWVQDLANSWSGTLDNLINDVNGATSADTVDAIKKQLSDLQDDIASKMKEGALKVGAKQWVQDLNQLKNDMKKKVLDRRQFVQNLSALQTKIKRDIADVTNAKKTPLDTAVFEFGGMRSGFCVSKILVDGNPIPIYGVPGKKYDELQTIFDQGPGVHRMEFLGTITDNINAGTYTNMTKTLFGICLSRQFDIIDLGGGNLVAITREKI
jgi:hypothetical protein